MTLNNNRQQYTGRFIAFAILIVACFIYLFSGIYELQIVKGEMYAKKAGSSAEKIIKLKGTRGMITDSEGVILAESQKMYNVTFLRNSTQNSKKIYAEFTKAILETLQIIEKHQIELSVSYPIIRDPETNLLSFNLGKGISAEALQIREKNWRTNHYLTNLKTYPNAQACYERLLDRYSVPEELSEEVKLAVVAINSKMQDNLFNSLPIVIAEDIPFAAVSEIEARSVFLTGIAVEVGEKRVYPRSTLASQIIGYTGKIQNYESYNEVYKPAGYSLDDDIGIVGIEQTQENWLSANISERQGYRVMERDVKGRLVRQLDYKEPVNGNNVKLTINAAYQQFAEKVIAENIDYIRDRQEKSMSDGDWLEKNKDKINTRNWEKYPAQLADAGVLIVMKVDTGKLLAIGQYPTYDLNIMVAGGPEAKAIIADKRGLTMNYAIQTRAEPGSIFKMVTGLAALKNGVITPYTEISDEGPFMAYTTTEEDAPRCWLDNPKRSGKHDNLNIVRGLTASCNYFFYQLGHLLYGDTGTNRLYEFATEIGMTSKTGIELNGELRSIVGNQNNLYDPSVSLPEQAVSTPIIVANSIKRHIINFAEGHNIVYEDKRLDTCIKELMDMALVKSSDEFVPAARIIFMDTLAMTRDMVFENALMQDLWNYLNTIKWGGSMEIQMAIGQSITLTTPVAAVRYAGALVDGNVWNLSIIESIISPEGEILSQREPQLFGKLEGVSEYLPFIKQGMKGVVDESGTARSFFSKYPEVEKNLWAKTGTSQITIGGIKIDIENNAWFLSVTPYDNPELALVSYIPNGMSGGFSSQAPRDWIKWWMQEQNKATTDITLTPGNQLTP